MERRKPEKRFQHGACSVSIFNNEVQRNGKPINIKKSVFQKRYKGTDDQWHTTQSLDTNDLPKASLCLDEAYAYLTGKQEAED